MEGIPQQARNRKPSFLQKKKIKSHSKKVEEKKNEKKRKQTIINSDEATWKLKAHLFGRGRILVWPKTADVF